MTIYPTCEIDGATAKERRLRNRGGNGVVNSVYQDVTESCRAGLSRKIPEEPDRATRDAKLCAAFTGRNHHELSRRYGISISCVYRVIARAMKARHHNLLEKS